MKIRLRKTLLLALGLVLLACGALYVVASRYGHLTFQPPVAHRDAFVPAADSLFPPALHASNNRLVTGDDRAVLLRGVMLAELTRVHGTGRFNRGFVAEIQRTGANVIRVSVHPEYWVRDPDYLWRYLDPIVQWTGELGMYVIIDWHYIGNIITGEGAEMPDIAEQPRELSLAFWRQVARHFRDTQHVIFEVFNEPAYIAAPAWRQSAAELVVAIRAEGASQLVIGEELTTDEICHGLRRIHCRIQTWPIRPTSIPGIRRVDGSDGLGRFPSAIPC